MALDFTNTEDLLKEQVSFTGKTETGEELETIFRFRKMGAIDGWDVMVRVREEVGRILNTDVATYEMGEAILTAILKLPTPVVRQLQAEMFAYVDFQNSRTQHQRVSDAVHMAFEGMKPHVVGEVLVRSLAVNFYDSITDLFAET